MDITKLDLKLELMNKDITNEKDIIMDNELITNSEERDFLEELRISLESCKSFYFSVAFINFSGLQLILEDLKETERKKIKGSVITSTYLNFTQPYALKKLKEFENIDLKIFVTDEIGRGFHSKAYIFEYEDYYKIYIGSSNLTQSALKSNEEWNVKTISKKGSKFQLQVMDKYMSIFEETKIVDEKFLIDYEKFINELKKVKGSSLIGKFISEQVKIEPNSMQRKALESLNRLREHGGEKSLVIAATGTGKTYMSAFDVKQFNPKRMLFIVHREDILRKAMSDYRKVIDGKSVGLFTGTCKDYDKDFIFATIQSISSYFNEFDKKHFDYIVIDEAHHASSETYKRVLEYFKPKFLLGMTATPERSEGTDIFSIFDNNIALEVRLNEALEEELVVPFHYFGITDIESIDYNSIDFDIDKIAKLLQVNERVDFIIEKMNFYGHDGDKRKCIGFCANVEHANYMASEFNKKGIKSIALTGKDSVDKRQEQITCLEDDNNDLELIFTVDLFNEGVDIPSINLVLMLRPTESSIIFIQQLGRGLRKFEGKEFLTVLDFIGNHKKAFLIAIALNGARYYDKDSLKVSIATDFASVPGATNIQMDRISKERILAQIDAENFKSLKYLKEEYNEFKKNKGGKVVNLLNDYLLYDGAPNPMKFLKVNSNKSRTYLGFLEKVEKDFEDLKLLEDEVFIKVLKDISSQLTLKRPFEFIILRYLIKNESGTREELRNEIEKYIENINTDTFNHAIECLKGDYYDSLQKKNNIILIDENSKGIELSKALKNILSDENRKIYINDSINYGLIRYEKEFGEVNYGMPFFKLYNQYQMVDAALLSNYRKIHSSFRGSGLVTNGDDWFLFIDLHKEDDIKESINYKDKFIDRGVFQWQSPNNTSLSSERGRKLINNVEKNVKLHLFVRKYKEIDGGVEPYIYIGQGDTISHEGEKPITVHFKLRNEMPVNLYTEFTKKI